MAKTATSTVEMPKAFVYGGLNVYLSMQGTKFFVNETGRHYDTAEVAREAIDRHLKAKERKKPLALEVVSGIGKDHVITGIHSSNHNLLTKPPVVGYGQESNLLVDTPWIREALKEAKEAERRASKIRYALQEFAIYDPSGKYSDRHKPITELYDAVERDHAEKLAKAQATTLAAELERVAKEDSDSD
jgi:hypothetical protein